MTYRVYNKRTFYSGDVMNVVFGDHHSLQRHGETSSVKLACFFSLMEPKTINEALGD